MGTAEFAKRYLFRPLGISTPKWVPDPQGHANGGRGLYLRARDLAKFGFLYLNQGQWEDRQIIPVDWIRASTRQQSEGGFPEYNRYGYLWWVTTEKGHPAYYAAGYGGQYVYIVPDFDIVVAITSKLDQSHPENKNVVSEYVIPAIE
jgi:CubicO group peptidase (beta-lactamase class C family)